MIIPGVLKIYKKNKGSSVAPDKDVEGGEPSAPKTDTIGDGTFISTGQQACRW